MSTSEQLENLKALTEISAALPAAQRKLLGPQFAKLVKALGLDPLQHGYLARKRPLAHAPTSVLPARGYLDSIRFYCYFHDNPDWPVIAKAKASLRELSAHIGKSPKMIEYYLKDMSRRVHGICMLRRPDGVIFIGECDEPGAIKDLPPLADALAVVAAARKHRRF